MPMIKGYDVAYTHRGSWRAYRRVKGTLLDEVQVAWDTDWAAGNPPSLVVYFPNPLEATATMEAAVSFVVAVAKKRAGGASSKDIHGLFEVMPVELVRDQNRPQSGDAGGVRCSVLRPCEPPEDV